MGNNLILKRFFTKNMLHNLLSEADMDTFHYVVRRYVKNPEGKPYEELISEIYTYIGKQYRTEYYYKNTMLNKLLLKKHNYKKTIVLTELPIADSKADFVMINGKGVVYEIKTELDNLDRLSSQISDYYKAFTEVMVVTYEDNVEKVLEIVPETAGVMKLTKRNALKTLREAQHMDKQLDYYTIFKILRKSEFENILKSEGYDLPDVSQFVYYKECFHILQNIEIQTLQVLMLKELKKRMRIELVDLCVESPEMLRFLTYFDESMLNSREALEAMLSKVYGG